MKYTCNQEVSKRNPFKTLPGLPGIQNIEQADFFCQTATTQKKTQTFSIVIIFSRFVATWQILAHILKKVLKSLKSGPKAPKIRILLSLPIFDRVNEIKIRFFEVTPHEYAIPKWYSMQLSVSYGLRLLRTC